MVSHPSNGAFIFKVNYLHNICTFHENMDLHFPCSFNDIGRLSRFHASLSYYGICICLTKSYLAFDFPLILASHFIISFSYTILVRSLTCSNLSALISYLERHYSTDYINYRLERARSFTYNTHNSDLVTLIFLLIVHEMQQCTCYNRTVQRISLVCHCVTYLITNACIATINCVVVTTHHVSDK